MVATAVGTPTSPQPGVLNPARHGRHAARARAARAIPVDQLRELRRITDADPWAGRGRLPRWHKRDEQCEGGWRNPETGRYEPCPLHSITSGEYAEVGKSYVGRYDPKTKRRELVREGTTSRVTWLNRTQYLNHFLPALLALAASRDVLRAHKVDPGTFRRWVRTESLPGYCEQRTGRRIIVRPQTVADLMEVSVSTVHRCRSAARSLGIYATVYPGRMLGEAEQRHARWAHGSPQRGMAAESAFVVPRRHAGLGSVTCLHRGASAGEFPINPRAGLTVNTEGEKERTPSARINKRRRRASPAWVLARAVTERLSWARGADPKDFVATLSRFATGELCWTADDVVRHIDAVNRRRGWTAIHSPADLKYPAGALLAFYLRDVDRDADHPRLEMFLDQERAAAAKADQLAARELHDRGERCGREWCC
jgi:hypothetical protein